MRDALRRAVGDTAFQVWLEPLTLSEWDGRTLRLQAPADTEAWVQERFGTALQHAVEAVFGTATRVEIASAGPALRPGGGRDVSSLGGGPRAPRRAPSLAELERINPRYSFEQFVMGDGNRLAHAAALAVAENPAGAYNPLFIYGPPGLGKTHLLHAIANYLATFSSDTVVRYTTVEAFTNSFIAALSSRTAERFKLSYRDVDVLLIDDVQFLASKARTEEELFHTFNSIHDAGRQLVLTCDRLPSQLLAVEERLRDRFQAGLVAQISPPDHVTRVAILRKRADLDGVALDDPAVLDLIAQRVTDNIRTLEGALIRLVAVHSLTGRTLDTALAMEVLDEIHPSTSSLKSPSIDEIQDAVASQFGITRTELISPTRRAGVSWPRQLAIHLARELTHEPLEAIGAAFGGRSHSAVLHARGRVAERVAADPEAAQDLEALHTILAVHN